MRYDVHDHQLGLVKLAEESSEVTKIVCKILLHTISSYNPVTKESNVALLKEECADLTAILDLVIEKYDLRDEEFRARVEAKTRFHLSQGVLTEEEISKLTNRRM